MTYDEDADALQDFVNKSAKAIADYQVGLATCIPRLDDRNIDPPQSSNKESVLRNFS